MAITSARIFKCQTSNHNYINNIIFTIALSFFTIILAITLVLTSIIVVADKSFAQENLTIGAFVSTKAPSTNMRKGAGFDFDVIIKYKKRGVPLKIRGRYEDWYKLQDMDNNQGWMHKSVISQKPFTTSITKIQPIFARARVDSRVIDFIAKSTILEVIDCLEIFCFVKVDNYKGWVFKQLTWGNTNGS